MSWWWRIALPSLAAVVFLTLPLIIAKARRSGRMTTREEERLWPVYARLDRRALEGWTPPWWYPPVLGSASALWALVTWQLTHDVFPTGVSVVIGIVLTIMAVVVRRQAGGRNQHSRDR